MGKTPTLPNISKPTNKRLPSPISQSGNRPTGATTRDRSGARSTRRRPPGAFGGP